MTGSHGYSLVQKAVSGALLAATFAVWAAKNGRGILAQLKDTQPDEFVGLVTKAATEDLPKLWSAVQAGPELPTA